MGTSLCIVGFQRGCTSLVHSICAKATGLKTPNTPAGEIFSKSPENNEPSRNTELPDYTKDKRWYGDVRRVMDLYRGGWVVKDVYQPFLVRKYAMENPGAFNFIFVDRPIQHVRSRQAATGFTAAGVPDPTELKPAYLGYRRGDVGKLLFNPREIFDALCELGYEINEYDYRTPEFLAKRKKTLMSFRGVQ